MMIFNNPQYVYEKISETTSSDVDGMNNSFDDDYSDFKIVGIKK